MNMRAPGGRSTFVGGGGGTSANGGNDKCF